MAPERVLLRFWDRVEVGDPNDCWPWKLSVGSHGYGQVGWHDKDRGRSVMTLAHRLAWFLAYGPIPEGFTVDHTCYVRRCCNPAHMRLLSRSEHGHIDGTRGTQKGVKSMKKASS